MAWEYFPCLILSVSSDYLIICLYCIFARRALIFLAFYSICIYLAGVSNVASYARCEKINVNSLRTAFDNWCTFTIVRWGHCFQYVVSLRSCWHGMFYYVPLQHENLYSTSFLWYNNILCIEVSQHWGHLSRTEEFLLTSVRKQYLWASTIVEFQIICSVFSLGDFFLLLSTYNDVFEVITSIYIFHYKLYIWQILFHTNYKIKLFDQKIEYKNNLNVFGIYIIMFIFSSTCKKYLKICNKYRMFILFTTIALLPGSPYILWIATN